MVYVYECPTHGEFELILPLRKWDDKKPCPTCHKTSEQIVKPRETSGVFRNPVVIHVSSDGQNFRFPGEAGAKVPKGFVKRELRTIREIESFERQFNRKLRNDADRHQENEERGFAELRSRLRSELRQAMQHFSPLGRDFAELAMKVNDEKRRKTTDCAFHVEVLHFDASRSPQVDQSTGWKRKYV